MQDNEKVKLISELEGSMRSFIRGFRRDLNDMLGDGFTSSEYSFLRAIKESNTQNISTLASLLGVSNSHATSVTDRLVDKQLVTRKRSDKDRRVVVLDLTPEGEETYQKLETRRTEFIRNRFEHLTKEELQELIRIFNTI
ncbi:MarR family winged helix-turn-helix transcriptional regulator [Thalassobacillus sp. CUG 92003]|uniref:MarR family winged helix-turn-helix transcriptional regulator n=1 Tax=Thalassobacillus sp. CUG 92003 TaxID=2736641 RepID=UPI0015E715FB|nr:MarR family transcriptional regulator [Thalassobacillus sp. CUG 92003]